MSKETIIDTPKATLWYHPNEKIVHHCIHKFIFGEEFYDLLLAGTEALKKHGATKWLSNDSSNRVLRTEDIEWGQKNWFPQTVQAGWKHWAIVQPESAVAKMNTDKIVEEYGKAGINAKYFTDEDEAFEWLKKQ